LTSQLRRTAIAIASNIAEGQGRLSTGEFMQYLGRARGSLHEVQTQLYIANNLGFLSTEGEEQLLATSVEIDKMLNGLMSSLR
jgi:four helix bundle protein